MIKTAVADEVAAIHSLTQQTVVWLTDKGLAFTVDVVMALVILLAGWLAIGVLKRIIRRSLGDRVESSPLFVRFVVSVVTKLAWAFLIVTVLAKLGVNVGALIAGLGATGFIVGFACQESLANLAAGMMIAINEPFKIGDRVKVAGFEGQIREVNMMATVLITDEHQRIIVPNKSAWGAPIVNFSAL